MSTTYTSATAYTSNGGVNYRAMAALGPAWWWR